ncbi:hypothetical protein HY30_01015 [Hyphomonas chukchiensis]|uniref:Uncharacterized protein n=1 Tax=Hyphomonas chukchiensis TaxID=1280947 RepID=A0A062URR4_9PROT|nr:hypothetical protein HY30_01015 [Hyphomonas chukchiensis]
MAAFPFDGLSGGRVLAMPARESRSQMPTALRTEGSGV